LLYCSKIMVINPSVLKF